MAVVVCVTCGIWWRGCIACVCVYYADKSLRRAQWHLRHDDTACACDCVSMCVGRLTLCYALVRLTGVVRVTGSDGLVCVTGGDGLVCVTGNDGLVCLTGVVCVTGGDGLVCVTGSDGLECLTPMSLARHFLRGDASLAHTPCRCARKGTKGVLTRGRALLCHPSEGLEGEAA